MGDESVFHDYNTLKSPLTRQRVSSALLLLQLRVSGLAHFSPRALDRPNHHALPSLFNSTRLSLAERLAVGSRSASIVPVQIAINSLPLLAGTHLPIQAPVVPDAVQTLHPETLCWGNG